MTNLELARSRESVVKQKRAPLTPWELPSLLTPVHSYRRGTGNISKIRSHFPGILAFIYRNRFAVASQIQRRFPDVLRSDRTTRRHLEELESLGLVNLAPTRGVSPLFPKVYFVTGRGVRELRKALAVQGKPWQSFQVDRGGRHSQEGYSVDHVLHEIFITEFLLGVREEVDRRADLELLTVQRRSLSRHPAFRVNLKGKATRLIPDALFLFRQNPGGMCCCLMEIDTGTMNRRQLAAKYRRYEAWANSHAGQKYLVDLYRRYGASDPRPTFRVLFVAQGRAGQDDDRRLLELIDIARQAPGCICGRCWFTTVKAIREQQRGSSGLASSIWVRGRDAAFGDLLGSHEAQTANTPRQTLFPTPITDMYP